MLDKVLKNRFWLLIGGIVAFGIGLGWMTTSGSEVKCGGSVMQPGDTCEHTRRGITTQNSYEEEKASGQRGQLILTIGGAAAAVAGGGLVIFSATRRKDDNTAKPVEASV